MQPTILYIHEPEARLTPEALRNLWAGLSAEEDCAWRLERCRAQRRGEWLILLDEAFDGRHLTNRLRRLSRKLAAPVMHISHDERLNEMSLHVWKQGQTAVTLSADGTGASLPLLSRALGWQVHRDGPDPEAFAALFGWTDVDAVHSLCSAIRPARALPHLTKLMGIDPFEAWRTIT